MAKLYFRYGAMNSGKSTLLLQTAHNYEENGMKIVLVKPLIDTKGDTKIVSRIGAERDVDLLLDKNDNLYEIIEEKYRDTNCVLIDEAQFLTKKQAEECMGIVVGLDIPVICYGLRTDFLTNGFPGSSRLLELAHTIEEMKTICACGTKAIYNARFVDGEFTLSGDQVAIDGEKKVTYNSMCAKCYEKEKRKLLIKK
jgi:thymidine kinase